MNMINNYLKLQFTIIKRKLTEFGINPHLGLLLLLPIFISLSYYLFSKTEFAQYIYILLALGFINKLSEANRNDFLKSIFSHKKFIAIRFIENSIIALPFVLFLLYERTYYGAGILVVLISIMAISNTKQSLNLVIPTPFFRNPFEFIIGFRTTYYIIFFAYFLSIMAILYNNFNLGLFSIALITLSTLGYYSKPENEFYVWSFHHKPSSFLYNKIKTAIIHLSILIIPLIIALYIYFTPQALIITALILIAYLYLTTIILSKYSYYPNEFSLPQSIFIAFSVIFPPLLIILIPYSYIQSIKRLNNYLK